MGAGFRRLDVLSVGRFYFVSDFHFPGDQAPAAVAALADTHDETAQAAGVVDRNAAASALAAGDTKDGVRGRTEGRGDWLSEGWRLAFAAALPRMRRGYHGLGNGRRVVSHGRLARCAGHRSLARIHQDCGTSTAPIAGPKHGRGIVPGGITFRRSWPGSSEAGKP